MDQLGGVDFQKGCYVGQEVVSRMQHRGTARTRILPRPLRRRPRPRDRRRRRGGRQGHRQGRQRRRGDWPRDGAPRPYRGCRGGRRADHGRRSAIDLGAPGLDPVRDARGGVSGGASVARRRVEHARQSTPGVPGIAPSTKSAERSRRSVARKAHRRGRRVASRLYRVALVEPPVLSVGCRPAFRPR